MFSKKKTECRVCGYRFTPERENIYTAEEPRSALEMLTAAPKRFSAVDCPICGCQIRLADRAPRIDLPAITEQHDAGADSAAGKELFNMKENKHGFEPKQEFTMGGIAWTVIQTGADWVKCIASDCVEERAFDEENKNDFAASSLRAYLNGEFLRRLIKAGAPEEMFEYFNIDLTADDGLKNYGGDRVRIGLITCEEYRLLRGNIPALPDRWWWTATPDSPINSFVRIVNSDGSLSSDDAYGGGDGVRPLCNLKSEILVSYLNGENAEEQKKRAEAVDMMKHIAAAWDIDAEEVFGRADE